jgi:hypothetical protein
LVSASPSEKHCAKTYTRTQFHHVAQAAFDGRNRATDHERRTLRRVIACQRFRKSDALLRLHLIRYRRHHLSERARREAEQRALREIAALTPYDCGSNGRYAIPCAIVACESGFSWNALNASSGARGPYQFLGWRVPWPVRTDADKLAHHRMAARLYAGGTGRSNWVC